jgi:hypothetical protein
MALADALEQATKPRRLRCAIAILLEQLDAADRQTLVTWLVDAHISNAAIERALVSQNHLIRQHTVRRHRKNECSCVAI